MLRYHCGFSGEMKCAINGEYVKWMDVAEKLFSAQVSHQESLTLAQEALVAVLEENQRLREELEPKVGVLAIGRSPYKPRRLP